VAKIPFYIVTLGCDKNTVDSEQIAGLLTASGKYTLSEYDHAHVVIINTCAFIDAAKEEAVDTIIEAVEFKKHADHPVVLVGAGCIVETDFVALADEIPEVDIWLKPSQYNDVVTVLSGGASVNADEKGYIGDYSDRIPLSMPHSRFVKISDGCDMACSYCTIPLIRGGLRSRSLDLIRNELTVLAADKRIKELIVVSQNTLFYGSDSRGSTVVDLIQLLGTFDFHWKRLMYMDIRKINDEILQAMKDNGILPYFDIPLQHVDAEVLRSMNRPYSIADIERCIDRIYKRFSDPVLRTTFITGFPTETETAFSALRDFVNRGIFHKVGVFAYSMQDKASASVLGDPVSEDIKNARLEELMQLQMEISAEQLERFVGQEVETLIDHTGEEGRMWCDAPEIDGVVYIDREDAKAGELYKTRIVDSYEYDLEGEIIDTLYS